MAIDNLNYYSSGLPAGQQTDKYSSQPGCLKSKNLDIFSSSKSVKATAWSELTTADSDIVKQDGKLVLKTDGKVYERQNGADTLFIDPSTDFPVYDVCYTGPNGTYAPATFGTVQDMVAKYEGDELKSFVVFTDRASYVYSKQKFVFSKSFADLTNITYANNQPYPDGYLFTKPTATQKAFISVKIPNAPFSKSKIRVYAKENASDDANISLNKVSLLESEKFYYDAKTDGIIPYGTDSSDLTFSGDITVDNGIEIEIPVSPRYTGYTYVTFEFVFTPKVSSYVWSSGELYIDMNGGPEAGHMMKNVDGTTSDGDSNYYYSYLPLRDRKLTDVGAYAYSSSYWMKGIGFQPLYKRTSSWLEVGEGNNKILYDFVQDMGWESDVSMDVIGMMIWNEQVYMIGNLDGNGYIIPCDLSGGRGTPFIAYGCTFKGVTNIDYLMYLVGEDRGISQLWVYNGQELVPVIGGKHEVQYNDVIGVEEQYKFDGKILNWRKNLILTTTDNRIFQYGQTYGGKGGTFIHELPENATITGLKTNGDDLEVDYDITEGQTTTKYSITYQDDTPIKNYNTQWEATYPIVIGNHLLEKEESDLYCSYILPSAETSLEFWGMANHYHFWTFKTDGNTTPTAGSSWVIDGTDGNYRLEFVEKNGEYLTFKLVGDLPVMTGDETMRLTEYLTMQEPTYIGYTEFNHFRKIGEITTTEYKEGEFRFHNLNNKLELPKSHSLQIMVKGKGNQNYTPELFALDLVANQRERG